VDDHCGFRAFGSRLGCDAAEVVANHQAGDRIDHPEQVLDRPELVRLGRAIERSRQQHDERADHDQREHTRHHFANHG